MKRILFFALLCISIQIANAQTGIGTNTPNAQTILDVKSDNKGGCYYHVFLLLLLAPF